MPTDPRNKYRYDWQQPQNDGAWSNAQSSAPGPPQPDNDPTNRDPDPSGSGYGQGANAPPGTANAPPGTDFWSRFLAAIRPYIGDEGYNQIAGSGQRLEGILGAAKGAFGGEENILKYLGYNPLKGAYTALSYLNDTPYYDKGNAEDGSETWNAFYVPGYDYDRNTAGVQGPSWLKNPYDPNAHVYKT
jgi:hypothetical protein